MSNDLLQELIAEKTQPKPEEQLPYLSMTGDAIDEILEKKQEQAPNTAPGAAPSPGSTYHMDVRHYLAWMIQKNPHAHYPTPPEFEAWLAEKKNFLQRAIDKKKEGGLRPRPPGRHTHTEYYLASSMPIRPEAWLEIDCIMARINGQGPTLAHYLNYCSPDDMQDLLHLIEFTKKRTDRPYFLTRPGDAVLYPIAEDAVEALTRKKMELHIELCLETEGRAIGIAHHLLDTIGGYQRFTTELEDAWTTAKNQTLHQLAQAPLILAEYLTRYGAALQHQHLQKTEPAGLLVHQIRDLTKIPWWKRAIRSLKNIILRRKSPVWEAGRALTDIVTGMVQEELVLNTITTPIHYPDEAPGYIHGIEGIPLTDYRKAAEGTRESPQIKNRICKRILKRIHTEDLFVEIVDHAACHLMRAYRIPDSMTFYNLTSGNRQELIESIQQAPRAATEKRIADLQKEFNKASSALEYLNQHSGLLPEPPTVLKEKRFRW